jgi:hypothetical protein
MKQTVTVTPKVAEEKENNDYLLLKWGTLKAWCFENSPEALEALKEYNEIGSSMSAMMQRDTDRQKELICTMIDKVNGSVTSDWDGVDYTDNRQGAKDYIMNYNRK